MKFCNKTVRKAAALVALGLFVTGFCGCAITPSDEESELPWNTPQTWEGAPSVPGLGGN